ncbi:hypothetical protein ACFVVA_38275 [Kitasatospora sp. NPDC058048]|uniref:hypothetical protein n=1 Tax=Kitasatospora sp. NPDC058048 TaxID=3346313 RepID=UPI0036D90FCD
MSFVGVWFLPPLISSSPRKKNHLSPTQLSDPHSVNPPGEHHSFAPGRQWRLPLPGFEELGFEGSDPLHAASAGAASGVSTPSPPPGPMLSQAVDGLDKE